MNKRRGFTLAELLITAIAMAILGTMLTRMLVSDSRFVSRIEAMMSARQTARAAVTLISSDLQMVSASQIFQALPNRISFALPIAWGMACQRSGGNVIATQIPTDSLTVAWHGTDGFIWIDSIGTQHRVDGTISIVGGPRAECTADSIRVLPGGQYLRLSPANPLGAGDFPSGSIFYTFELEQYEFKASVESPGRIGLWQFLEASGINEEVLWPFDANTRFEFVTDPNGAPSVTPPGVLSTLDAIELVILGESEETPRDATDPEEFELRTRVTFVN